MKLKYYLIQNRIKKTEFARLLGVSRTTVDVYINEPSKVPQISKIAIEYATFGYVNKDEDWNEDCD